MLQVASDFDFDQVTQILLSDPEECPVKEGFSLVKVVTTSAARTSAPPRPGSRVMTQVAILDAEKPPILLPYLFDSSSPVRTSHVHTDVAVSDSDAASQNKLTLWAFINSSEKRSTHQVAAFDAIS